MTPLVPCESACTTGIAEPISVAREGIGTKPSISVPPRRVFAHLCGFGGGLGPLPAWVRRLGRVRLWLDAKIAVYHARVIARNALAWAG